MIPKQFVIPALLYAIGVFYFVVWVLNGYYRRVLRQAIDEIHRQYQGAIGGNKGQDSYNYSDKRGVKGGKGGEK